MATTDKKPTTDKQIAEELKQTKSTNGKRSSSKESAKQGANRITDFINRVSDETAKQVADAITAATIQKAMTQLGSGDGPLTQAAIATFDAAFTEVLVNDLPYLTGADGGSKFLLTSASDVEEEQNLN